MPALHCPRAAGDCVTGGERGEAASAVVRSVLTEDVMLGIGAELRHCVAMQQLSERSGLRQRPPREGAKN